MYKRAAHLPICAASKRKCSGITAAREAAPVRDEAVIFVVKAACANGSFEPRCLHTAVRLMDMTGMYSKVAAAACLIVVQKFYLTLDETFPMNTLAQLVDVSLRQMELQEVEVLKRVGWRVNPNTVMDVLPELANEYVQRVGRRAEPVRYGAHFLADCLMFVGTQQLSPSRAAAACLLVAAEVHNMPRPPQLACPKTVAAVRGALHSVRKDIAKGELAAALLRTYTTTVRTGMMALGAEARREALCGAREMIRGF